MSFIDSKILSNSAWMLIEKAISLFGLIFIISAVAKYVGTSLYGEIVLASSIFIMVKTVAQLGLDQIYFKYVSADKPNKNIFLKTSIEIVSFIYMISFLITIGISYFFVSFTGFCFIIATGIAYYFNSTDLLNAYFEGKLLSKINVLANVIGLIISLILRWLVVFFTLDPLYLCIPIILFMLIPVFVKWVIYQKNFKQQEATQIFMRNRLKYYKNYIYNGVPLIIVSASTLMNGQIANFLLGYLGSTSDVGIYSVGFVLAGAWNIVPVMLIMGYLTKIYAIHLKEYRSYIELSSKVFWLIFILSLIIIFILYFISPYIIIWLYGLEYVGAVEIFRVLLLFQLFWLVNFYFSRLIIRFSGYKFLSYKTTFCSVLYIILAYLFVAYDGRVGAAYAALLVEFIGMVILLFYSKAKLLYVVFPFYKKDT